jgi:ankyrin repeat protein
MEELAEAIDNDSVVKVRALCKAGADLTAPIDAGLEYGLEDPDNMPVLFYAIRKYASVELIEVLLEYGCDIREIDEDGLSAIDISIKFKREDMITFCVDKGIDVNETHRPSGITPIVLASCFNNTRIVELLIKYGAEVNAQDKTGMSAKDYAKKLGQKKMVEFLTSHGAKFNRYVEDAVKEAQEAMRDKVQRGDMKNRSKPTDDMGFDSI